jgi:hypothetical protein
MNSPSSERLSYVYQISPDDVIEFVNDAWLRFAVENGSPKLSQEVIGTSIWNHISGQSVVQLSRDLLAKVRESGCEVTIPFRCDSPWIRRFMWMNIAPLAQGRIEFRTWIEQEEPYKKPIQLLDPAVPRDDANLVRMCAWCKKIDVEGEWFEIENAIAYLRLFDFPTLPAITHGICKGCLGVAMRKS